MGPKDYPTASTAALFGELNRHLDDDDEACCVAYARLIVAELARRAGVIK